MMANAEAAYKPDNIWRYLQWAPPRRPVKSFRDVISGKPPESAAGF